MDAGTEARPHPKTYDYSSPKLDCDIIMKGGVTSGVVYPWAVCELAKTYRFRCVGGASAGAIAAAGTAAAEYGRATGGFETLAELPQWLGQAQGSGPSKLFALFQPQKETRPVYRVLVAGLGESGAWRWIVYAAAAVRWFWLQAGLGALFGVAFIALALKAGGVWAWLGTPIGAFVLLLGAVLGGVIGLALRAVAVFPANGFGLCRGFSAETPHDEQLTPWLDRTIRAAAGTGKEPLTFGMLWKGPNGTGSAKHRAIQLETMTTDLTEGLPAQMPWDGRSFFFDPDELRTYFPDDIVQWMEARPSSLEDVDQRDRRAYELLRRQLAPLRPLPDPENMPVVVAARMSLSFPVLISAVPLHSIDWGRRHNNETRDEIRAYIKAHPSATDDEVLASVKGKVTAARHWFSDGGLCSNFPVHLFDAPLPERPTFGLNLRGMHPDNGHIKTEAEKVYLPAGNREGYRRWLYPISEKGLKGTGSFFGALAKTMQNWQDNSQITLAGYRDRIVHVSLSDEEGGLNLNMRDPKVTLLAERGRLAAELLANQFAGKEPGVRPTWGWTNHRWIRYRIALAEADGWLSRFAMRFEAPSTPDTPGYRDVVRPGYEPESHGFDWWPKDPDIEAAACKASLDLVDFVNEWPKLDVDLTAGAPKTRPRMRLAWRPGGRK